MKFSSVMVRNQKECFETLLLKLDYYSLVRNNSHTMLVLTCLEENYNARWNFKIVPLVWTLLPWLRFFRAFSSVVRQMPGYCIVLIVCTVTLLPGVNPIAVDKYIYLSILLSMTGFRSCVTDTETFKSSYCCLIWEQRRRQWGARWCIAFAF